MYASTNSMPININMQSQTGGMTQSSGSHSTASKRGPTNSSERNPLAQTSKGNLQVQEMVLSPVRRK